MQPARYMSQQEVLKKDMGRSQTARAILDLAPFERFQYADGTFTSIAVEHRLFLVAVSFSRECARRRARARVDFGRSLLGVLDFRGAHPSRPIRVGGPRVV